MCGPLEVLQPKSCERIESVFRHEKGRDRESRQSTQGWESKSPRGGGLAAGAPRRCLTRGRAPALAPKPASHSRPAREEDFQLIQVRKRDGVIGAIQPGRPPDPRALPGIRKDAFHAPDWPGTHSAAFSVIAGKAPGAPCRPGSRFSPAGGFETKTLARRSLAFLHFPLLIPPRWPIPQPLRECSVQPAPRYRY